jgi:hypothetical protein
MAAGLPLPSIDENVSTTLSSGITDVASSMDVGDASKIPGVTYAVIDRVDSAGTVKASSLWEYVKITNVAGNTLTITRAQGGSTAQAHGSGAVVELVATSSMFEDWYAALNPEHTASGGHVIATATIALANSVANIIGSATVTTSLNVSSASVIGLGLNPSWFIPSLPSNATTGLGRPAAMPRGGTLKFINVTLNGIISSPSVAWDIRKNGTSIFDNIGRPFMANGTFVSTASIKTPTFNAGDVLQVDYVVAIGGGNSVDAIVTAAAN